MRIKFNGSEIDYETMRIGDSVIDPEKSLIFKDKEVIYQEVLKGIDIKYTINNGLITEEFIVKNREASSRLGDIKQSLKTSGLNVISTNHESFGFFLPDGKEALKFSDPFVRDNKGEIFRDIKMSLKKKGLGGYELSKTLNKNLLSWMNAEIRSYPVSIDPSVVVSGGIADGETQFGSMQRKVAPMARSAGVKIDDAGDPGALRDSGSRLVRTSAGVLYAVINDTSDIEVYSSTDAVTWTEQDSADGPTDLDSSDEWAIAIDSSDDLHIVYVNNNNDEDIDYITFDTSSNQFGTDEQAIGIGSTGGQTQRGLDIALDSNNVPHVITCEYGGNNRIRYANRVGGSWNTDLNPDTGQGYNQASIAINEDDLPEIAYLGSTDGLVAEIGNANNATSFTEHIVDSGAITSIDIRGVDIEVDSSGNTWIVYVDETGATDYVTLVKHNDADGWTTWQTPTHNSNAGVEPTLSIADNNVYVVYADENADVAWDRYNGSWAGETVRRAGTFQDVRARSANNFHNFDHSIDLLYSDGTDIYWDSLLDNYYVFYNESGDISYKKSTDGGVQWNTAVTVDDADTDNYNPTLSVSNGIIHVFWVDDGGELIEGRRINTASSDAQGTLCQTGSQGTISSSFMPTIAKFSDTSIMLAYSDTSSDSEVDIFEITGLDGSCTVADRNPGNITFGSGVTAGDRPALVSIDSNTIDMVFQDGNLSYSRFEADLDEWVRNNLTIASVTHNVYSVASDGTTVWVLVADTTQNDDVLLYSCCTDDWATTTIDSDIGTTGDGKRSNLDIFCVTDTDCKIVYTDNIDSTGSQDLVFVDCDDATCSSPQSFTIDADLDGDTDGTTTVGNPAIFCTSTDDCKVVYQDNYDNAAPDAVFYDCDDADGAGDNIPCDDGATATITDTDIGGISTLSSFDIYCVSSTECAYVFFEDNNNDITFVDCETDECATASDIVTSIVDVGTTTVGPYASIYCPSVDTCKVVTHDVDAGSMVFVNCVDGASAANDESCIGITPDTLDASVGTTVLTVGVAVDCVGGETDCKVAYVDVTDGDLTFLDCNDTDCDSPSSTTDIDVTAKSSVSLSLNMHCISATDCKIAYINSDSSSNFIDCDDAACNSGSVILVPGTNVTKINLFCPASGNCKLVYQSDPASGDPSVALSECDSTNCYPTATDASDPWTGETEVEAVSLTYDSTNSDLYAHVIMDSSDQAYFKSTDATSISWGTEYSYNFTAGDLGQISATETAAGFAQIGISLRQGSNYEFSTLPENMWLISVFSPILIITSKKIKLKRKRKT
ncbi:MAG: hypothetical protein KBD41_08540 [Saprospiraceae bacterium]|nr:hypothetical protein [Saprospiraceae bacterium]